MDKAAFGASVLTRLARNCGNIKGVHLHEAHNTVKNCSGSEPL